MAERKARPAGSRRQSPVLVDPPLRARTRVLARAAKEQMGDIHSCYRASQLPVLPCYQCVSGTRYVLAGGSNFVT